MKRLTLLAALAALAAALIAVAVSPGSSHREAPGSMLDPSGDWTDVYFFTPQDKPGHAVVVANVIPFEDPAGGPFFYTLDPKARYYINFDNTGDGRVDVRYKFQFSDVINRNTRLALGQTGPVTSPTDPDLTLRQTYDVTRERFGSGGNIISSTVIGNDFPVAPSNFGPKTMPNYSSIANASIRGLPGSSQVFVGQRDDPFYVDLGEVFDLINFRPGTAVGNRGGGKDDLAGYAVHSFVLDVAEPLITKDGHTVSGSSSSNAVVGVWASTERQALQATQTRNGSGSGSWVRTNRLGNPLINELVIPVSRKDEFNRTLPKDDGANFGQYALEPEIVKALNSLFNLGCPTTNRTDIVTALFTGIPTLTQIGSNPAAADTLKLNLGVAPKAPASENRLGVIAGDTAGFPNGRRLGDDVVDVTERVACGVLVPESQGGKRIPLGDGVDRNDKAFLSSFPYAAAPTSGFNSQLKRTEPAHAPAP